MSHRKAERPFSSGSPIDFRCHFTNVSTEKKDIQGYKKAAELQSNTEIQNQRANQRIQKFRAIQNYREIKQSAWTHLVADHFLPADLQEESNFCPFVQQVDNEVFGNKRGFDIFYEKTLKDHSWELIKDLHNFYIKSRVQITAYICLEIQAC